MICSKDPPLKLLALMKASHLSWRSSASNFEGNHDEITMIFVASIGIWLHGCNANIRNGPKAMMPSWDSHKVQLWQLLYVQNYWRMGSHRALQFWFLALANLYQKVSTFGIATSKSAFLFCTLWLASCWRVWTRFVTQPCCGLVPHNKKATIGSGFSQTLDDCLRFCISWKSNANSKSSSMGRRWWAHSSLGQPTPCRSFPQSTTACTLRTVHTNDMESRCHKYNYLYFSLSAYLSIFTLFRSDSLKNFCMDMMENMEQSRTSYCSPKVCGDEHHPGFLSRDVWDGLWASCQA